MTTVTMRAALADAGLLGSALVGDSWATWRVFLIAAMGEKLNAKERAIFRRFTGRAREPGARIEEALFLIGRRGGKDRASAVLATHLAALVDWSAVLAKGERGLVLCIGADTKQAAVQRDYIEGVFDASPILSGLVVNRTADSIELSNGIAIEVRAASFRRLRGVTTVAVIASEAAFWLDDTSANADVEILNAVRPTLATTGGPLVIITTPYAERGVVWDMHSQHFGAKGDPLILVVQGETRDFNPTLSQKVVDRAMERDPASAAAEYLAKFRTDVQAFVSREQIAACVVSGVRERAPVTGTNYVAFVDPSGGTADSMTLAIAHRDADGRAILDLVREKRPPFSPADVVCEFAEVLKSYGVSCITGDKFGGEFAAEPFKKAGIGYEQWDAPKSDLYSNLLPMLNSRGAELLDDGRLVAQLCALERRTSRAGKDHVGPGPRAHDDLCNSVAGALMLAQRGAPALWRREDLPIVPGLVVCEVVFAVLVANEHEIGVGYFARDRDKNLHVVAASGPMTAALLDGVPDRLLALAKSLRAISGCCLFTQAALVGAFARRGHVAHNIDAILAEGHPALALSAAAHIAQGRLKIGDARHAGILTGWGDDPLRLAMLVAVAVGLDTGRSLGRAA